MNETPDSDLHLVQSGRYAVEVRVRGLVQGVSFRDSTRRRADELGVDGFVCNEPDGSVWVLAEGHRDLVEQLVAWCRRGPPHARVAEIHCTEVPPRDIRGFKIVRTRVH